MKEIAAEELLKSGNFHGVSSPGKESMSARSLTSLSVADKSVIAQLINSYKTEVHKLSKLRAEHRRLSQLRNSSEVLNVNHNSSNNNAVDTIDYVPKEKVLTTATSSSLPNETPIEKWRRERDIRAKKKQEMIERSKDAAAIASTPAVTEDENINNSTELNDDGDEELDSEWEYENGDIYDLVDQTSHYPVENVSYTAIAAKTSNLVSKVSKLVSGCSEPPPFPENNASKSTEDVNSHSSDVDYPPKVEATITEEEKRFLQEAIRQDIRNSFGLRGGIRNNAPSRTISTDSTSHHRGGNAILENHSNEVRTSLRSSGDGYSNSRSNSRGNNAPGQRQGIALAIMENNVRNILDQGSMNI